MRLKNLYYMQSKLRQIATWNKRKAILLMVLCCAIVLLGFSLYHFAARNQWLEQQLEKSSKLFEQTHKKNNGWAYSGTGTAVSMIVLVFVLLLREVRLRKKLVEELRIEREHYRITINSMAEGLITTGRQGEILYMNAAAERLTGWSNNEAKNLPLEKVYDVVNEESGKRFEHIVSRILRKGQLVEFENNTLLKTKHQSKLVISNSGSPLFDSKGNIAGTVLVFNDITEKKKIETELKESEQQYRMLIQNLPEAVYTCDANGYVKLYNKAAITLWGREPVAGKDLWCGAWKLFNTDGNELRHDDSPMALTIKKLKPLSACEIIIQRPDGSKRNVIPYPTAIFDGAGQLAGAINMLIDVTEKKEKELFIKESEEKYRALIEQASDAIIISDRSGKILEVNYTASKLLGYTNWELAEMNIKELYSQDDLLKRPFMYNDLMVGGKISIERDIIHRLGSIIPVEITAKMLSDGRFMAIIRDISDRKKAEKEIRDYQFALDTSCIVDITDENGVIRYVNENFCSISKYRKEELVGRNHNMLNAEFHTPAFINNLWSTISKGKVWRDEMKNKAKDGTFYWVDSTIVPFLNQEGKPFQYITIRTDITRRKESEAFITGVLNSLSSHIAVINSAGTIIKTNTPWNNYSIENGVANNEQCGEGANYFDACKNACLEDDGIAVKTMIGIKKVLFGTLKEFYLEYPCHSPSKERWFYMRIMKFEGAEPLLVIEHHDMTERKRAEIETLKAIERYEMLSKATSDTIWDWDITSNKMQYNSGITNMFGYTETQVNDVINWWKENIHPDDLQLALDTYYGAIEKTSQTIQLEYRFRCAGGNYKYIYDRSFVTYDANGKPLRIIGAMQDVTYAKEEEKRIAKAVIHTQEQERLFIGQELHDNVNQLLASSLLTLSMVKHYREDKEKVVEFAWRSPKNIRKVPSMR